MSHPSSLTIDYAVLLKKYPWIIDPGQNCILSPDVDGLLCGLFMSQYLNWQIKGFYDGKSLLIVPGISARKCIFLDMEILREGVRSVGHHMNIHMLNTPPIDYHKKMSDCINPNYIRGFDRQRSTLARKYPLGAIHFLMYILENYSPGKISVRTQGLAPIFFADGVWKILFKYTGNVLDWFDYLHHGAEADWWVKLKNISVIDLIQEIDSFIAKLKSINPTYYGHIDLFKFNGGVLTETLSLISDLTGWELKSENWNLENLKQHKFTKEIYGQNRGSRGNMKFLEIWNKQPLSLAMTEGAVIQYTLETPDRLS
ncbi:MAG: hypothetical protein V1856_01110 [Candidatus Liptonbacteria bacterium]